jgi:microcystin-dependent protein
MSDPFIGQIIQGGWNFAPRGYAFCNGQLLAIAQNSALFSLLGTTFGGNGTQTFGLPNLQGRVMVGWGNGAGLSPYVIGQTAGSESVSLNTGNLPAHTHQLNVASAKATVQIPVAGSVIARGVDGATTPNAIPQIYCPAGTPTDIAAGPSSIGATGNNTPVGIVQPYQAVTFVIALEGIFPSRN